MKIVIVGHVDHGKSTLIGRLLLDTHSLSKEKLAEIKKASKDLGKDTELAFLTDQLKEERARNITMDTTEIQFKTKKRRYVIIDAPGHLEFVKNMLSGATSAEAAVLVIDAQEGIREQTKRHSYLIHFIGLRKLIVVINKMDLVHYSEEKFLALKKEYLLFAKELGLDPTQAIAISAKEGKNIPEVLKALDSLKEEGPAPVRPVRFPVQDVYSRNGKTIVVGKVAAGVLKQNQTLEVRPCGTRVVVREIKSLSGDAVEASADQNIGLLFQTEAILKRGDILCDEKFLPKIVKKFTAHVFWLAQTPMTVGETYLLRSSTQESKVHIAKILNRMNSSTLEILEKESRSLRPNEAAEVEFICQSPLVIEQFGFIEEFGRFVLDKEFETLGFGLVTE